MKKGIIAMAIFLIIFAVQLAYAEDLGNNLAKETSKGIDSYYKPVDGKKIEFKRYIQSEQKAVLDLKPVPASYYPSQVKSILPANIKAVEDYDNSVVLFYITINGEQSPEAVAFIGGESTVDVANKKILDKAYPTVNGEKDKSKMAVNVEIQFTPEGEVKVTEGGKLVKHVLKDGTVKLYKDSKLSAQYNMYELTKLFPKIKNSAEMQRNPVGIAESMSDKIVGKEFTDPFMGGTDGTLMIFQQYGAYRAGTPKLRALIVSGNMQVDSDSRRVQFTKLQASNLEIGSPTTVSSFTPTIYSVKAIMEILASKDVKVTTSKSEWNWLKLDERNDEGGYIKTHNVKCSGKCELEYFFRAEDSKEPVLNIKGEAMMLAPDKDQVKFWKEEWKRQNPKFETWGIITKDKYFDNIKFRNITIKDVSDVGLSNGSTYFGMEGKASSVESKFGEVTFSSNDEKIALGIEITSYFTTSGVLITELTPKLKSANMDVKQNGELVIMLENTGKSGSASYFNGNSKFFSLTDGKLMVLKDDERILDNFVGKYPLVFLKGKKVTVSISGNREVESVGGNSVSYKSVTLKLIFYTRSNIADYNSYYFNRIREDTNQNTQMFFEADGGRQMLITYSQVVSSKGSSWEDYGVDFSTYIYDSNTQHISLLECRISERKCYLNNKPITFKAGSEGKLEMEASIQSCDESEKKCPADEKCVRSICVKSSNSKWLRIPAQSNAKIFLLFINGNAYPKDQFKNVVEEIVGIAEGGGKPTTNILGVTNEDERLFNKEPFKSRYKDFAIFYIDESNIMAKAGKDNLDFLKLTEGLREEYFAKYHYPILISGAYTPSGGRFTGKFSLSSDKGGVVIGKKDVHPSVITHELGHAIFFLDDEYFGENNAGIYSNPSEEQKAIAINNKQEKENRLKGLFTATQKWNCAIDKDEATKKGWISSEYDNAVKQGWRGCGGGCEMGCSQWVKPSQTSIMKNGFKELYFNDFSIKRMNAIIDKLMGSA